jgi:hypothetical protein
LSSRVPLHSCPPEISRKTAHFHDGSCVLIPCSHCCLESCLELVSDREGVHGGVDDGGGRGGSLAGVEPTKSGRGRGDGATESDAREKKDGHDGGKCEIRTKLVWVEKGAWRAHLLFTSHLPLPLYSCFRQPFSRRHKRVHSPLTLPRLDLDSPKYPVDSTSTTLVLRPSLPRRLPFSSIEIK